MLSGKRLLLIGAGQMGEALIRGFLNAGIVSNDQVLMNDISEERLGILKSKYGLDYALDSRFAVKQADIILLAVKPQQMSEVISGLRSEIKERAIVISIAAGVTTQKLESYISRDVLVIRVMPNTPALVGEAMSVLSRGSLVDDDAMAIAITLFGSIGKAIELPESEINMVTAISGSGPAYFFLFVEKLIDAAIKSGLNSETASLLARQTFIGAAYLLKADNMTPGALREMVTSPGGTTAAAIQIFQNREFGSIVQEAVNAAIHRAGELA